jgi:epoxyqueuosine reductase
MVWLSALFSMNPTGDQLFGPLRERGYRLRMVSAEHISSLKQEIGTRSKQGELDQEFYTQRLAWFKFELPEQLEDAQSIIIVAVPRPQTQATFTWKGRRRPLILPPTYTAYDVITNRITVLLGELLGKKGYRIAATGLPLKLLAARSGLVQYGRNNITYVPGMGSFLQLVAVYSDMPCVQDSWQEPEMMAACKSCEQCRKACPTGAIPSDRFLLRAERCIVFHNEKPGNIPFPAWMKPEWHNCIEGCLHCQRACPLDREFMKWIEGEEEFSEQETTMILNGVDRESLPADTAGKLQHLSILDDLGILPRNLGVFFREHT